MSQPSGSFEDMQRDIELLAKHLPIATNDNTLLVLKGHLLVELLLTEFIESRFPKSVHIEEEQFRFPQRVALARALGPLGSNDWVWGALAKLNAVRNALAHHLDHPKAQEKLDAFIASVSKDDSPNSPADDVVSFGPLPSALIALYFGLADKLRFKPRQLLFADALRNWQPSNSGADA